MNATWPLVRLTIGSQGFDVESSSRYLRPLLRVFGLSPLSFRWDEVDEVSPRRGLFPSRPLSNGVSFVVRGRTMIWWAPSKDEAARILAEVGEVAPETASPGRGIGSGSG